MSLPVDIAAEELLERVIDGDGDGVVAVLRSMREPERRACVEAVLEARDPWQPEEVRDAQALAEFGVLPPSKIKRLILTPVYWHDSTKNPRFEEILRLRPRPWRQRLLRRANRSLGLPWPMAYRLVRDGLAEEPNTPWYYAASIVHVDAWRDDHAWLNGPFWELFECEQAAIELSRSYISGASFVELADTGRVPRERLVCACMAALRRDFAPRATRFYRLLFEALRPTSPELALVSADLLALLGASNSLDVGLALSALTALQNDRGVDGQSVLAALAPALTARAKKHAFAAIDLAASVRQSEPALIGATVELLTREPVSPSAGRPATSICGDPAPLATHQRRPSRLRSVQRR